MRTALDLLYDVLVDLQTALNMATAWLGDEELRLDARTAVSSAADLIENATETLDLYSSLATQLQANASAITTRLMPVMDELAVTLVDVRRLTHKAVDGDGTVAQLLNNPDLYRSLEDAAISLERTLLELQLLLQKINAEGVRAVY